MLHSLDIIKNDRWNYIGSIRALVSLKPFRFSRVGGGGLSPSLYSQIPRRIIANNCWVCTPSPLNLLVFFILSHLLSLFPSSEMEFRLFWVVLILSQVAISSASDGVPILGNRHSRYDRRGKSPTFCYQLIYKVTELLLPMMNHHPRWTPYQQKFNKIVLTPSQVMQTRK